MWQTPPETLDLPARTVDLWRLSLEEPHARLADLEALLDDAERARAARFRFQRDRHCYTLTRATLRALVSGYLSALGAPTAAQDLQFTTGAHGKPALADSLQPDAGPFEFNVSHSGTFSLLAFGRQHPVGVDVEHIHPRHSLELVAEHHFADSEFDAVMDGPDDQRLQRFYRCWTRKEAYMKATGKGLAVGLKTFAVSVDDEARLLWTEAGDAEAWSLRHVAVAEEYVGAVCVGRGLDVRYFALERGAPITA